MSKEYDLRMGQFAMSTGIINAEQLSICLKIQKKYKEQGHEYSLIDILCQQKFLSHSQIEDLHRTTMGEGIVGVVKTPSRIANRYTIIAELGRGGMGIVYKAYDEILERHVAIKVLRDFDKNGNTATRFLREAKAMSNLKHPNIVEIYDIAFSDDFYYFVMEYVEGGDLRQLMRKSKLSIRQAVKITISILQALKHTHEKGIIHRDIKPDNIMICSDSVKVMDFGLAKIIEEKIKISKTCSAIGTVHYMSPEQMSGERKKINTTTDLYSVGVTLHEMLTGRTPFLAKSFPEALAKVYKNIPPLYIACPKVPKQLSAICLKSLAKKGTNRYLNAQMFIDDLENFLKKRKNIHAKNDKKGKFLIVFALCIVCMLSWKMLTHKEVRKRTIKNTISDKINKKHFTIKDIIMYRGNASRTGNYDVLPLRSDPRIKWTFSTSAKIKSSPIVHNNIVYFGSYDYFFYALDINNGRVLWKFRTQHYIYTSPAIYGDQIFIASHDSYLYALNIKDGTEEWRFKTRGNILSSPLVWQDKVYIGSHDGNIYALDANSGHLDWNYITNDRIIASPSVYNNILYVGSLDGNMHALTKEGKLKWKFKASGSIKSTAAIDKGVIFFGDFTGNIYALKIDGTLKWKVKTKGEIHSSASISENNIYIGSSDGYLYALGKKTGRVKWKIFTNSVITMSPTICKNMIYFGSMSGSLFCADLFSGKIQWQLKHNITFSSPVIKRQTLFAGSINGIFYAFH